MKFVKSLTAAEEQTLKIAARHGPTAKLRQRAQAIVWSHQKYRLSQIAELLAVHYTTVSGWIDRWESQGLRGLYDELREGRPLIYSEEEVQQLQEILEQEPRSIKQAQAKLAQKTGKTASAKTLKRALKKRGYVGSGAENRYARSAMTKRSKRANSC